MTGSAVTAPPLPPEMTMERNVPLVGSYVVCRPAYVIPGSPCEGPWLELPRTDEHWDVALPTMYQRFGLLVHLAPPAKS